MSVYEIRVKGRLDQHWATWFEGLTLAYEEDTTVLRGALADEAALHNVLTRIGGLNLHLLSVNTIEASSAPPGDTAVTEPDHGKPDANATHTTGGVQPLREPEVKRRKRRPGHPS